MTRPAAAQATQKQDEVVLLYVLEHHLENSDPPFLQGILTYTIWYPAVGVPLRSASTWCSTGGRHPLQNSLRNFWTICSTFWLMYWLNRQQY